jgi:4'-phosphopantetheinyl transferase EntD
MTQQYGSREEPASPRTAPGSGAVRASLLLRELLPQDIACHELLGAGDPAALLAEEKPFVGRASLKRACEFAAGRICARAGLEHFGIEGFPLKMGEDRSPRWPRALCGSIAHTRGYCASAVGAKSRYKAIGLDVEQVAGMSAEVWDHICAPAEVEWLQRLPEPERARMATLIFSAKEAFYKCQYAVTRQWLEFTDVTVDLTGWELGAGSFAVRPLGILQLLQHHALPWLGRFRLQDDLVITTICLAAD